MEFLKRKNTLGSARSNSPTHKPNSKLSRSTSISDQADEFIVVEGSSQASADTVPLPRAASLVSLHVAAVPNCEGSSSQQLDALRDELALWKAKAETFEARMQDALARAEQADARLERIAAECHQDKDALHKQLTALEVAKETACAREQEAIRRAEEAEVRNAHLVETLAVFQGEVGALRDLAERTAEPVLRARVPVPLGEEIASEERTSDYLKIREGKTYSIQSVMTGTVAKVSAIGQSLWAGQPSGGDDEKWTVVSVFRGGVTLKNVARQGYAAIATPDRWGNCNIVLSETATIWALSEQLAERGGTPYQITPTSYRNLVWDLNGGRPQNGTQISAYINQHGANGQKGKNQAWYLVEV